MPTVTVKVGNRIGADGSQFPGYGSAGVYWPTGETTRDVTDEQLKQLEADAKGGAPLMVSVLAAVEKSAPKK